MPDLVKDESFRAGFGSTNYLHLWNTNSVMSGWVAQFYLPFFCFDYSQVFSKRRPKSPPLSGILCLPEPGGTVSIQAVTREHLR
jgi:hypothetical protein